MEKPEYIVNPEFRDKIPPLTLEEYEQLRENILEDGEVYEPKKSGALRLGCGFSKRPEQQQNQSGECFV